MSLVGEDSDVQGLARSGKGSPQNTLSSTAQRVTIPAMSHEPRPPAAESQLGKGGQPNIGVLWRTIRAGQGVIHTPANSHERRQPRDIRGM